MYILSLLSRTHARLKQTRSEREDTGVLSQRCPLYIFLQLLEPFFGFINHNIHSWVNYWHKPNIESDLGGGELMQPGF